MMAGNEIWIFADATAGEQVSRESLELLGLTTPWKTAESKTVCGVLMEEAPSGRAALLGAYGADKVYRCCDKAFCQYAPDLMADVVCQMVNTYKPEVLLFSANETGRELAARVSSILDVGLTADCTDFRFNPDTGKLVQIKPAFGAGQMVDLEIPQCTPQIATLVPGIIEPPKKNDTVCGITDFEIKKLSESATRILEVAEKIRNSTAGLSQAEVVVVCGRGVGGEKGVALCAKLAQVLHGELGATKAVTDAGWMSHDRLVGQTGVAIQPKLYIACGVSGAVQHTAGIQKSEAIVAINTDEYASIFEIADYGIVGDLFQVIPALIHAISGD